jgi:hypothetical protein
MKLDWIQSALAEGLEFLSSRKSLCRHEVGASAWLESPEPENQFRQRLIRFHHLQRNNPRGAARFLQSCPGAA